MYSVSQIAHAYNYLQVRSFREHVMATGLNKKLPKLMRGRVTIYRKEVHTIMEYLGATPKIKKLYEIPCK